MADENKRNLQYFEAPSMRELFSLMQRWQEENEKRLLSFSVEKDDAMFCCIAVTNPAEVVITDLFSDNRTSEPPPATRTTPRRWWQVWRA